MSYLKKKGLLSLILIFVLVFTSCNSSSIKTSYLVNKKQNKVVQNQEAAKKWISDIDYLQNKLPETHPDPFFKLSKKDFNDKLDKLKKDVPYLEDYQIKIRIQEILALMGDAHTSVESDISEIFPIWLWWFGKDLRVISVDKEYKQVLGMKLKEINGIPIEKIMDDVNKLISHENNQWLRFNNVTFITFPYILKYFNIISDNNHIFKFEGDNNKEISLNIPPKEIHSINLIRINNGYINRPNESDEGVVGQSKYWYKYVPADKILYFQFNSCLNRETAKNMGYSDYNEYPTASSFSAFSDKLKATINNNKIDKLIIDMSYNGGGDIYLLEDLITFIQDNRNINQKGKLFIIIGRNTFSAAVYNSSFLKNYSAAMFYGEPTGGAVNMFGAVKTITLPKTSLNISCPTVNRSNLYPGNTLNPDVSVQQSFEDYKKGIDDVYEAIKNYKN